MSVMANLLCFGRFAAGWHVNGGFFFTHCNIYNCTHTNELPCLLLTLETASLFSGFFACRHAVLFECAGWHRRHTPNSNSYSISSRGNYSKIFAITNIWEKNCRASVPVGSIIPCLHRQTILTCSFLLRASIRW